MTTSGALGAAVFALGLSLAGPHGVATADGTEGDSAAVVGPAGATQQNPGPVRTKRIRTAPAPAAGAGDGTVASASPARSAARAAGPTKPAAATRSRAKAGGGPSRKPGAAPVSTTTAAAATSTTAAPADSAPSPSSATSAVPAGIAVAAGDVPAPASASAGGTSTSRAGFAARAASVSPGSPVAATVWAAQLLDGIGHWFSVLPPGPVSTLLSGALQLVRRNLFEDVPIVHVSNITASETNAEAVFTVTLDKPFTSPLTVGYRTAATPAQPGEAGNPGARAVAGSDYQDSSGVLTFAPGQTSQQVVVVCLDDHSVEAPESFTLEILAVTRGTTSVSVKAAAATPSAAQVAAEDSSTLSRAVIASATATIVDNEFLLGAGGATIDVNPNFAYGDALLAANFSDLAYNHRVEADFNKLVQSTGWQGIGVSSANLRSKGYSPTAGGYGVIDGWTMQSYAFAGKRTAPDGTVQFVVSFEGSNSPLSEPADWIVNAGQYGWSRYYTSLEPLMTEVVGQILQAQSEQKQTQLILTGHSLGGAAAEMAFADLLTPQGDLWPDTSDVLAAGSRVLDTVGDWSDATRTALLAATSVYTFGAPSMLIEPTKPGTALATAFATSILTTGFTGALGLLPAAIGSLTVDENKVPDFTGIAGINFGSRAFQFEHANSSWWYPGDVVAQLGSRDPGRVLEINLDNAVQYAYTPWYLQVVPGGTHPMALYRESVLRLITNQQLLKNPNDLAASTPQLTPTAAGQGSDGRNDYFVNLSDTGKGGNDVFAYKQAGTYVADGGAGTDTYSVSSYNVSLTIDGALQSGRDSLVFNIAGTPGAQYSNTGSGPLNDTAVFSVTAADGKSSSVTITHWDRWQVTDVFQVIGPADGQWSLEQWTVDNGPVVAASPVDEVPLSVL